MGAETGRGSPKKKCLNQHRGCVTRATEQNPSLYLSFAGKNTWYFVLFVQLTEAQMGSTSSLHLSICFTAAMDFEKKPKTCKTEQS